MDTPKTEGPGISLGHPKMFEAELAFVTDRPSKGSGTVAPARSDAEAAPTRKRCRPVSSEGLGRWPWGHVAKAEKYRTVRGGLILLKLGRMLVL